ncbi:MAG: NUMOD4 domain-containing protein [Candidatus Thorarchaeota archaeon]
MTISVKSRKAKARWLQNFVCQKISDIFNIPWGYEDDKEIKPRIMGQSGPDVILSNYVADMFKFRNIECKSAERWNILKDINQIKNRAIGYLKNSPWLLILKCKKIKNPIVIIDADYFFELLSYTIERWKEIPGFEGFYEISNFGNIRSYLNSRHNKEKFRNEPVLLNPVIDGKYKCACLSKDGKQYKIGIHRMVLLAFVGPPPEKDMQASHKNGHSFDNRLVNLCWETSKENNNRKYNHKTMKGAKKGEKHHNAKLTNNDVKDINILYSKGDKISNLASKYGVSYACIYKIVNNISRR